MADLSNLNKVSFQLDERAKLRATIGLNAGMTMGMIAAFVAIILSGMVFWYKAFAAFGIFCAILLQIAGVIGSIQRLKAYNQAMAEYAKLNASNEPAAYHG